MWIVVAVFLFYLAAIPIECALEVRSNGVSITFSAFKRAFTFKKAQPRARKKSHAKPDIPLLIRSAWAFIKHLHPDELALAGTIGCTDAASTALVCGAFQVLSQSIQPVAPRIRIQVAPDFSKSAIQIAGILSARVGHIIFAALFGARIYLSGRFRSWINTRSKAS